MRPFPGPWTLHRKVSWQICWQKAIGLPTQYLHRVGDFPRIHGGNLADIISGIRGLGVAYLEIESVDQANSRIGCYFHGSGR